MTTYKSHKRRGRPPKSDGVSSLTENSRRYREQLKAGGGTTLSTTLSPEAAQAMERIATVVERFGNVRGSKKTGAELGLLLLDEFLFRPAQVDLISAGTNATSPPGERFLSLFLAFGLDQIRQEMPDAKS